MGELSAADGGDLGVGFGDYLPAEAIPYQRALCSFIFDLCFRAKLADWQSVAVGNFADYRPDVPAFYFFDDHRPPNHRAFKNWPVYYRDLRRPPGNDPAAKS